MADLKNKYAKRSQKGIFIVERLLPDGEIRREIRIESAVVELGHRSDCRVTDERSGVRWKTCVLAAIAVFVGSILGLHRANLIAWSSELLLLLIGTSIFGITSKRQIKWIERAKTIATLLGSLSK